MRRLVTRSLATLLLCAAAAATASAQDFQKNYQLGPNGSVEIHNVSGNIQIAAHEGAGVSVSVFKEGRDRDKVRVEDLSTPDRVFLKAKYDEDCNCDASLRFEVRVPRSSRLNYDSIRTASGDISAHGIAGQIKLQTASGNVTLEDVSGDVDASTASGSVKVREASGTVSARSASGNVDVEIARLEGARDLKFASASGNVNVRLPNNLDARVNISTASGDIETNFPIEVRRRENGSGSTARGQLGGGTRLLRISSASGDVSLKSL